MFRPEKLWTLIEQSGTTQKDVFEAINITSQAWRDACNGSDIGVRKVERVADYFNKPIDFFFDREAGCDCNVGHNVNGLVNHVSGDIVIGMKDKEIEYLKQIIAEKERLINLLSNADRKQPD